MSNPQTALAPVDKPARSIRDIIQSDKYKKEFSLALPKHLTVDRFVRIALTALTRTPKLAMCDERTMMLSLLTLSSLGLEPDGRRAHLIPFENKKAGRVDCQLIIGYQGLVELVRRSGEVSNIHADIVHENDEFTFEYGSNGHLKHKPSFTGRGKAICAYSYVKLKDGSDDFSVMGLDEVNDVRDKSQGYKSAIQYNKDHPWISNYAEMAKKTAFRRHAKWLPLSPELRETIEKDDEGEINVTPEATDNKPKRKAQAAQDMEAEVIPTDDDNIPFDGSEDESEPKAKATTEKAKAEPVQGDANAENFNLNPNPPDRLEKLRIECGEYGFDQARVVDVVRASKKFSIPRSAKSFDELTEDCITFIESNLETICIKGAI